MVRLSSAVCAISGVCVLENTVPLDFRKLSRCGICSRSEGTLGLSREKCTLSNTMLMTCWTPLPNWQALDAVGGGVATAAGRPVSAATVLAANAEAHRTAALRRVRWRMREPPGTEQTAHPSPANPLAAPRKLNSWPTGDGISRARRPDVFALDVRPMRFRCRPPRGQGSGTKSMMTL